MEKERDVWYIQAFVVAPPYRGQKVGSKLMEGIQMKANELKKIVTLQVYKNKPENIAFYKKNGFVEISSDSSQITLGWFPNIPEKSKPKTPKKTPLRKKTVSKKKKKAKK